MDRTVHDVHYRRGVKGWVDTLSKRIEEAKSIIDKVRDIDDNVADDVEVSCVALIEEWSKIAESGNKVIGDKDIDAEKILETEFNKTSIKTVYSKICDVACFAKMSDGSLIVAVPYPFSYLPLSHSPEFPFIAFHEVDDTITKLAIDGWKVAACIGNTTNYSITMYKSANCKSCPAKVITISKERDKVGLYGITDVNTMEEVVLLLQSDGIEPYKITGEVPKKAVRMSIKVFKTITSGRTDTEFDKPLHKCKHFTSLANKKVIKTIKNIEELL